MAAGLSEEDSLENQQLVVPGDIAPGLCDGSSSESSASSPSNCNGHENIYGGPGFLAYPFSGQYSEGSVPAGLIPVELEIEGLYEDFDRRRKRNEGEKTVSPHVHSRRRAQNRASQRAFRDRKEKYMKTLEQRIVDLESRHNDLAQSYKSLQVEYSKAKEELNQFRQSKQGNLPGKFQDQNSEEFQGEEDIDPLFFDVSAFYFTPGEGQLLEQ